MGSEEGRDESQAALLHRGYFPHINHILKVSARGIHHLLLSVLPRWNTPNILCIAESKTPEKYINGKFLVLNQVYLYDKEKQESVLKKKSTRCIYFTPGFLLH